MTARNWKRGEVARLTLRRGRQTTALCIREGIVEDGADVSVLAYWADAEGSKLWSSVVEARALVVTDPENINQIEDALPRLRDQIEAVARVSVDDRAWARILGRIQDDLIDSVATPKLEEPTGLGAVVEDADGVQWVRWTPGHPPMTSPWRKSNSIGAAAHKKWGALGAVRVLAEGVAE